MSNPMRLALHEDTTVEQVDPIAWKEDWTLQDVVQATDGRPYQAVWTTEGGAEVRFVDDRMVGLPYLVVEGNDAAALAASLRGRVPIIDEDDVLKLERDASTVREQVYAVLYAGIATGPGTPAEVLALIERAARSANPDLRQAAAIASSYARRRELRPAIQELLADPDGDVREEAENVMAMLDEAWTHDL